MPKSSPPSEAYFCPDCTLCATEKAILEAHQRASRHAHFRTYKVETHSKTPPKISELRSSCIQKMTSTQATQFRCCDCEREFKSTQALYDHLRYTRQHKKPKAKQEPKELKCPKCPARYKRIFESQTALNQHLQSSKHRPLSNIKCPADENCRRRFSSPSALLSHLESGACVSGMTQATLNSAIVLSDPTGAITSRGATAPWTLEDTSSTTATSPNRSPILTPASDEFSGSYPPSAINTPTSTSSTTANFHSELVSRLQASQGSQICPLCPPSCGRRFGPVALKQHLLSKAHKRETVPTSLIASIPKSKPDITFHCPRGLMGAGSRGFIRQFSSVSALAQHLESGSCVGGMATLKRVADYVQAELKSLGLRELKLLM